MEQFYLYIVVYLFGGWLTSYTQYTAQVVSKADIKIKFKLNCPVAISEINQLKMHLKTIT